LSYDGVFMILASFRALLKQLTPYQST